MNYFVNIYDMSKSDDPEVSSVGSFTMEADSELDALMTVSDNPEYFRILKSVPEDVHSNLNVQIENEYVRNLDISVHASGSVRSKLDESNINHIRPGIIIFSNNGKRCILNPDNQNFNICITGERSFEADIPYCPKSERIFDLPKYDSDDEVFWIDGPVEKTGVSGPIEIDSITVTVIDKNQDKGNEMWAWGKPTYDKDGNAVYQITRGESPARNEEDDFTQAVESISTKESGQSL